jgi:hypothetical protein
MARVLFLFMDGVGLGPDDPEVNPWVAAQMPNLNQLLRGHSLTASAAPYHGPRATLLPLDASLGVAGTPQSATGQATLLTGRNVSAEVGEHYGPKPNEAVARILMTDNLFHQILHRGGSAALINAYPPVYFDSINSGRRLYSAIPMAAVSAGIELKDSEDLIAGRAMSADFTGVGWNSQGSFPPAPTYSSEDAGALLASLSSEYDLAFFDYWASDYVGHKQAFEQAIDLLESFDGVLEGLLGSWGDRGDLILLTSDHGNMEDMSARGHTDNPVPALLIGPESVRMHFKEDLFDLAGVTPAILNTIFGSDPPPLVA